MSDEIQVENMNAERQALHQMALAHLGRELSIRTGCLEQWQQGLAARTVPGSGTRMASKDGSPIRCRVRPKRVSKHYRIVARHLKLSELEVICRDGLTWGEKLAMKGAVNYRREGGK